MIATLLRDKNALILASSDLTHYESQASAAAKDQLALAAIEKMDPLRLGKTVEDHRITMCGVGPVIAMLTACKRLGATKSKVLCYASSGDITKDYSQVVAYASAEVTK